MRQTTLALLTAVGLLAPMSAAADVLVMNNGQKLEGRAESIDGKPDKLRFTRGVGTMEIARTSIKEVIEESDSVDYRRIGLQMLDAKSYKRAIELFDMSLELDPNEEAAVEGRARARAAIEQAELEAGRESALRVEVDIEAARKLIAEERFDEAENLLQRVAANSTTDAQRTAAQLALIELHSAWGFQRLDRLDTKGAEIHYTRVLEMDPNNADARERLLEVWKDDPARREDVLKAYTVKLQSDPDNLELNAKVADSLLMMSRFEDALPMLEKLALSPRYKAQRYDARFHNTLREIIRNQSDAGNYDAAIGNTEKLLKYFPSEDSSQLVILQYRKAVATADPLDTNNRARLISGLRNAGLKELAASEAAVVARVDPNNEILQGILREEAEERLGEVRDTLQRNEFAVARDMARGFIESGSQYPDLVAKATEMYERASVEAERQARENRQQAREIAQRGIEYYQQALSFASQLRSTEVSSSVRPYSAKQEAIKYSRRSIDSLKTAISMDPSLAGVTGMDLNARLSDARQLLSTLTQAGTPLGRNRFVAGQTVETDSVIE